MLGQYRHHGIVLLVAYFGYNLNPLFHEVDEHVAHPTAKPAEQGVAPEWLLTSGCPEHCKDPSHHHGSRHSEHCPACQLAATWFAPTLIAHHLHVTDSGRSLILYDDGLLKNATPFSADPIRGPPLPPATSVRA